MNKEWGAATVLAAKYADEPALTPSLWRNAYPKTALAKSKGKKHHNKGNKGKGHGKGKGKGWNHGRRDRREWD